MLLQVEHFKSATSWGKYNRLECFHFMGFEISRYWGFHWQKMKSVINKVNGAAKFFNCIYCNKKYFKWASKRFAHREKQIFGKPPFTTNSDLIRQAKERSYPWTNFKWANLCSCNFTVLTLKKKVYIYQCFKHLSNRIMCSTDFASLSNLLVMDLS